MTLTPRFLITFLLMLAYCSVAVCQVPRSNHVYILAEENHSYEHLVGSADMPYLNSLIKQNGLSTQFYANQHSSLPNYFWVTSGQPITEDNETTLTFDVDNIVRRVMQRGLTYKSYAQSLPYAGYAGLYSGDFYLKRHAPLPYYSDMGNSPTEMLKHVPIDQLTTDIAAGNLPNFAFITPDSAHDMHDCPTTESACEQLADQFLKQYIAPLLARPEFQPGGDGLLIIWADEADLDTDNRCSASVANGCGGRILVSLIGPNVKPGYQSTTTYHHESVLRTMLEALGVSAPFPAAADNAPDMAEFFNGSVTQQLTVSSPTDGATVGSQMHVVASAQAPIGIDALQIYVDDTLTYTVQSASMDTMQALTRGPHFVVIKAWDKAGNAFSKALNVTATAPVPIAQVTVSSPLPGSTVNSPMHVAATGTSPNGVAAMQIYSDGQLVYSVNSTTINTYIDLRAGVHSLTVKMWDVKGNTTKQSFSVTATTNPGVTIISPTAGSTVGSPVHVIATASTGNSSNPIGAVRIYVDDKSVYTRQGDYVDTLVPLSSGSHRIVIVAWDQVGAAMTKSANVTVP